MDNSQSAFNSYDKDGQLCTDINTIQDNADFYGDQITKNKHKDVLRIGFLNINGLPSYNEHMKNERIFTALKDNRFDIIGLAEVNKNWGRINSDSSWRARTRSWWEASKTVAS